jgi:hypothetical protein
MRSVWESESRWREKRYKMSVERTKGDREREMGIKEGRFGEREERAAKKGSGRSES